MEHIRKKWIVFKTIMWCGFGDHMKFSIQGDRVMQINTKMG